MTDEYDTETRELREHESRGVKIQATLKRGTGTRDEDKIRVEVKDPNPAVAADKFWDTLERADGIADKIRSIQPRE